MPREIPTYHQVYDQLEAGHKPTVLVRRENGHIHPAKLNGKRDAQGRPYAEYKGGYALMDEQSQSDQHQELLANELAGILVQTSSERMPPPAIVSAEMGDVALEAAGVHGPEDEGTDGEVESHPESTTELLLNDPSWNEIDRNNQQLQLHTKHIFEQIDEFDALLASIHRDGGLRGDGRVRLSTAMDTLRGVILSKNLSGELLARSRDLYSKADKTLYDLKKDEEANGDDVYTVRKVGESAEELVTSTRSIDNAYSDMRGRFGQYGHMQNNVEELIRTNQGYEHTIASLRSELEALSAEVSSARRNMGLVEMTLNEVRRRRNASRE